MVIQFDYDKLYVTFICVVYGVKNIENSRDGILLILVQQYDTYFKWTLNKHIFL